MPRTKAKKPTAAEARLNALLGLTEKVEKVSQHSTGRFYGISETEMQEFRAAQGLIYFLAAPELFHPKTCKHCGEAFIVSRMFVACCSYTCIRKDLEARGFKWEKGRDIEQLVQDPQVYDGNEPLWIREPQLRRALEVLKNLLENTPNDSTTLLTTQNTPSSPPSPVSPEKPSLSTKEVTEVLPAPTGTTTTGSTAGTTLSKKRRPSRKITFGD